MKEADMHHRHWLSAGFIVVVLGLAGCGPGTEGSATTNQEPAQVVPVTGTELKSVVLTADAAKRLGIKTEPVRQATAVGNDPDAAAPSVVSVDALLYDKSGDTWVYTAVGALTFVREPVTIARIDGGLAFLQSGPAIGTLVVTVGAAELLGTEYGVEGER